MTLAATAGSTPPTQSRGFRPLGERTMLMPNRVFKEMLEEFLGIPVNEVDNEEEVTITGMVVANMKEEVYIGDDEEDEDPETVFILEVMIAARISNIENMNAAFTAAMEKMGLSTERIINLTGDVGLSADDLVRWLSSAPYHSPAN